MTRKLVERTSQLECEVELERNKMRKLKEALKDEERKRRVLELDVDDLMQSTNVIASWTGVSHFLHLSFLLTHPFLVPT